MIFSSFFSFHHFPFRNDSGTRTLFPMFGWEQYNKRSELFFYFFFLQKMNRNEGKFFLLNFRSFFGFFFIVDRISVGVFTRTTPKAEINEKRRGSSKANDEPMACRNGAATRTAAGPPLPRRAVCHQKSSPDWSTATLSTTRHAAIIRRPSSFPFFFPFCSSFDFVSLVSVGSRVVAESHFWVFFSLPSFFVLSS